MAIRADAVEAAPTRVITRRRRSKLTHTDKVVLTIMLGIPTLLHVAFIWFPALFSIFLSFTRWDGIGGLSTIKMHGLENFRQIFTIYPPFWPAFRHNIIWLAFFLLVPTMLGLFLAYLLDKQIKFGRFYQSVLYMPVVLSTALMGFIVQLIWSPDQGLVNGLTHGTTDWLGSPKLNLWAVLVVAGWRHAGYIMILYLAGLKSVDSSLREASAIDGANEWQTFRSVIFPTLKPINIIVLVVTVIESLRAFDIVYVVNRGQNGLELLSVLVTNNIIGEASRIGYGSAIGVILLLISLGFIITYLFQTFRKEVPR